MKYPGTFLVLSANFFTLIAVLPANGGVLTGNPYTPVATRNVFGLQPIVPAKFPVEVVVPSVTISLTGIMTILGSPEALFKTSSAAKTGGSPKNEFYTLGGGETQNDIEVMSIDTKNEQVVFRNHGVIQTIKLTNNSVVASR